MFHPLQYIHHQQDACPVSHQLAGIEPDAKNRAKTRVVRHATHKCVLILFCHPACSTLGYKQVSVLTLISVNITQSLQERCWLEPTALSSSLCSLTCLSSSIFQPDRWLAPSVCFPLLTCPLGHTPACRSPAIITRIPVHLIGGSVCCIWVHSPRAPVTATCSVVMSCYVHAGTHFVISNKTTQIEPPYKGTERKLTKKNQMRRQVGHVLQTL